MPNEPEKVDLESPDLAAEARAKLAGLFPGVLADGVLDATRLAELLDTDLAIAGDTRERYGLMWAGKTEAVRSLQTPSRGTLAPDLGPSGNWDNAKNVFIEGDNLEVLKLLQKSYNDKIKLIYIDPPYNTGNDFVYHDDFRDGLKGYLEYTGQLDDDGYRASTDVDTAGRRHSAWLSMLYPRLVLARNLLRQDGAIFVSIDDNEAMNLKSMMDDVFGQENFIAQLVWAAGRKNDSRFVSVSHEYIFVYARDISALTEGVGKWRTRKEGLDEIYTAYERLHRKHGDDWVEITRGLKEWFRSLPPGDPSKRHSHYSHVDARGVYFPDNASWPGGGGPAYEVLHPATGEPVKIPSRGWIFQQQKMQELIDDNRIHFGADENAVPCVKAYLADREYEVPYSVFYVDGRGATKRLRSLLGGAFFENPKDETVIQKLVEFATSDDDLILDFFAGSGTTAHAVELQNAVDGGKRKWILINLPEPTPENSAAAKAGLKTVSSITRKRISNLRGTFPSLDEIGVRNFTLRPSNFESTIDAASMPIALVESTLAEGSVDTAAIAAEVFLKEGVPLDARWERRRAAGADVVLADGVAVVLAADITEEIAREALSMQPSVLVFLEDGFAGHDSVKANIFTNAKQLGVKMKTV